MQIRSQKTVTLQLMLKLIFKNTAHIYYNKIIKMYYNKIYQLIKKSNKLQMKIIIIIMIIIKQTNNKN